MASGITTDVVGMLVAVVSSNYDFVDDKTKERRSGTSVRAWVARGFDEAPVEVTVPNDPTLRNILGMYREPLGVSLRCEISARTQRGVAVNELRLVGVEEVEAPKRARATAAG